MAVWRSAQRAGLAAGNWIIDDLASTWSTDAFGVRSRVERFCRSLGIRMPREATAPHPLPMPDVPVGDAPVPEVWTSKEQVAGDDQTEKPDIAPETERGTPTITPDKDLPNLGPQPEGMDDTELLTLARRSLRRLSPEETLEILMAREEAKRRDPTFRVRPKKVSGGDPDPGSGGIER